MVCNVFSKREFEEGVIIGFHLYSNMNTVNVNSNTPRTSDFYTNYGDNDLIFKLRFEKIDVIVSYIYMFHLYFMYYFRNISVETRDDYLQRDKTFTILGCYEGHHNPQPIMKDLLRRKYNLNDEMALSQYRNITRNLRIKVHHYLNSNSIDDNIIRYFEDYTFDINHNDEYNDEDEDRRFDAYVKPYLMYNLLS